MKTMQKPYWKFETESWDSSYFKLYENELTMDILWPCIKEAEWNGKKKNYRLVPVDESTYELQTDLHCGEPCDWQEAQIIKRGLHY